MVALRLFRRNYGLLLFAGGAPLPRTSINQSFVNRASCPASSRKIDYFDTDLPGFMVEVRESGGCTFYQRYRDAHGRERQFKIGPSSILTVKEAREKARTIAARAALGGDPQAERRTLRATPRFSDFVQTEYLPFAKQNKRSWKTDETLLRLHIVPVLGKFAIDEITDKEVGELRRRLENAGYSSGTLNRTTILIKYIFNQAKRWRVLGVNDNPAVGFKIIPDVCRERYLLPAEIERLLKSLEEDVNTAAAAAIKLLLLTGARRNEVTQAKWEYVDWNRQTLLVPLSKNGKPRHIKLSTEAITLLRDQKQSEGNPYIFPAASTGRPCPSLFFPWSRIRARADLVEVRLHDLRHSFASMLANGGVSIYTVQRLLGHTNPKSTQRYAHLYPETLSDAAELVGKAVMRAQRSRP